MTENLLYFFAALACICGILFVAAGVEALLLQLFLGEYPRVLREDAYPEVIEDGARKRDRYSWFGTD